MGPSPVLGPTVTEPVTFWKPPLWAHRQCPATVLSSPCWACRHCWPPCFLAPGLQPGDGVSSPAFPSAWSEDCLPSESGC